MSVEQETYTPPIAQEPPPAARKRRIAFGQRWLAFKRWIRNRFAQVKKYHFLFFKSKACPHCYRQMTERHYQISRGRRYLVCHYEDCQEELPQEFFESKEHTIAIVGRGASGKSTYITVLLTLLLGHENHLPAKGIHGHIVNKSGETKLRQAQKQIYDFRVPLDGNPGADNLEPYVLRLFKRTKEKIRNHFFYLHDIPGEEFDDIDNLLNRRPNLSHADGIIFLLDPLGIKELSIALNQERSEGLSEDRLLHNILEVWSKNEVFNPRKTIKVPVAVCVSKADILEEIQTFYFQDELDRDLFEWKEGLDEINFTSMDCKEFLEDYDEKLIDLIESRFQNVKYFPVSPLGFTPEFDQLNKKISPKGVISPFVWLLEQLNF